MANLDFLASNDAAEQLAQINRGIEKEGLRVNQAHELATTPHPQLLGSALTSSWITTDFSESLLEFITPVHKNIHDSLDFLADAHGKVASLIDNEDIWAASMPCALPTDEKIPLAQYGNSNIGTMKTAYRRGLGYRYGRAMQTVAGVHYNFSLPDAYWNLEYERYCNQLNQADTAAGTFSNTRLRHYTDTRYLDLIRNFRRNYWLLIYLFGAAPCVDASFLEGRPHNLDKTGTRDYGMPHATSLRMGDLGYQSAVQKSLFVCYNELNNYIATLQGAIKTPYPAYEKIGTLVDGEYRQLSTSVLQIENEFYSAVRPKRVTQSGEKPLHALRDRGIQYIEVRCMDIDPFAPLGISEETIRFLDTFLVFCLAYPSAQCDEAEFRRIGENQARIVKFGRDPDLQLDQHGKLINARQLAADLLGKMQGVADALDCANQNTKPNVKANQKHASALATQREKIEDQSLTPAARLSHELQQSGSSFLEFTAAQSARFMQQHRARNISSQRNNAFNNEIAASQKLQKEIEQNDSMNFDEFLKQYYSR
ncbi:MAG: glutamate--cysteine ligase [Gammaproteobacteria bacterium]|nr:glutamate--cysteine ligase [Gammaproteobacteria bacterium]MBT8150958.1 glutamate--cysteine ligase [Gammaproteobacteria bacterium]NND38307.1 glutamate--cysteine ligase [Pseudomonadales bacterium]NNL11749.1 glutamate--cysteine ligase [Pseudomonadales bacterium]NNM11465.1 glutamate--cysteine ligase [Pseudomonadales bacterium]